MVYTMIIFLCSPFIDKEDLFYLWKYFIAYV